MRLFFPAFDSTTSSIIIRPCSLSLKFLPLSVMRQIYQTLQVVDFWAFEINRIISYLDSEIIAVIGLLAKSLLDEDVNFRFRSANITCYPSFLNFPRQFRLMARNLTIVNSTIVLISKISVVPLWLDNLSLKIPPVSCSNDVQEVHRLLRRLQVFRISDYLGRNFSWDFTEFQGFRP